MTLYHAVSGQRPFAAGDREADELPAVFPQLVHDAEPLPSGVPDIVQDVIRGCLRRDPALRPAPRDVVDALEPVLASQPRATLSGFRIR